MTVLQNFLFCINGILRLHKLPLHSLIQSASLDYIIDITIDISIILNNKTQVPKIGSYEDILSFKIDRVLPWKIKFKIWYIESFSVTLKAYMMFIEHINMQAMRLKKLHEQTSWKKERIASKKNNLPYY